MEERILVLYNLAERLEKGIPSDLICEQEITIIVPLVVQLLKERGYQVETMLADLNLWENLKARWLDFDIVLNLAEAFGGGNNRETVVPAILEGLSIPFTGATAHNMHFTMDKEKTKLVLMAYGLPTAKHQVFRSSTEKLDKNLTFPLIVKPVREEASIGIYHDSVVGDETSLRRKIEDSLERYSQPVMAEEFIVGREVSVGIIGNNSDLEVFPPLEFIFEGANSDLEKIRSYEYKWGGKKEQMVRAELPADIVEKLVQYSKLAFVVSDCCDYARMDYRIDPDGNIYLLEVNYNPGIGPNTHGLNNTLTMMASFEGYTFEDLIEKIILLAMKRHGVVR
ncbi:MAG TPA: D-alanine--D-alanine ligase [Candidatus Moranbacteria bacterium]|nr:MAG: D-alanine-D-alanine ligase domain protein [Candidatus Moranbacteria bacterium GW2011_GWF1_34_10]HBI16961.1 D-alanine--D-alanine ligase [Candidatus Moranbacteria bacterium]